MTVAVDFPAERYQKSWNVMAGIRDLHLRKKLGLFARTLLRERAVFRGLETNITKVLTKSNLHRTKDSTATTMRKLTLGIIRFAKPAPFRILSTTSMHVQNLPKQQSNCLLREFGKTVKICKPQCLGFNPRSPKPIIKWQIAK